MDGTRTGRAAAAICLGSLCAPAALAASAQEAPAAPAVTRVDVDRELDVGTLALVQRGLRSARSAGHAALVVAIDTPGGAVDLMSQIARILRDEDELLTVGWVRGNATSAGALVTLACERVYMRASATLGSATPVVPGLQGIEGIPEEGGVFEKVKSVVRAEFRAVAASRGRPPELAEAMVDADVEVRVVRVEGEERYMTGEEWDDAVARGERPDLVRTVIPRGKLLNVTGPEAVALQLADGLAEDMGELLARIGQGGARVVALERSSSEEVLSFLAVITPLLLVAGLMLGYMELKTPGFGLPGVLSLLCFGVVLTGKYMAGLADVPHVVLVVAGLALIAVELFLVPGTIWVGLIGGVLVLGGLVASELGPGFGLDSELSRKLALDTAWRLALTALAAMFGVLILSRFLPDTPVLRRLVQLPATAERPFAEAMRETKDRHAELARVGATGVALTALRPVGKVALDDDASVEFEARAEGDLIDGGRRVKVIEVLGAGARLLVVGEGEGPA